MHVQINKYIYIYIYIYIYLHTHLSTNAQNHDCRVGAPYRIWWPKECRYPGIARPPHPATWQRRPVDIAMEKMVPSWTIDLWKLVIFHSHVQLSNGIYNPDVHVHIYIYANPYMTHIELRYNWGRIWWLTITLSLSGMLPCTRHT
jgi:hypothetical protein